MFKSEQYQQNRKNFVNKRQKRKCPGHWVNKRLGIKKKAYNDEGICMICGGVKSE